MSTQLTQPPLRTTAATVVLLLASAALVAGAWACVLRWRQVGAEKARAADLATANGREQRRVAELGAMRAAAERELAAMQAGAAATAATAASTSRYRWTQLVKRFQAKLDAMPEQKIAEMRLLRPRDWLQAAYLCDDATEAQFHRVVLALQAMARKRMAEHVQEALRRWVEANSSLPSDVRALLPYLAPPADAEMLEHFSLLRTGPIGDRGDPVLVDSRGDVPLRVSVDSLSFNSRFDGNAPDLDDAFWTLKLTNDQVANQVETLGAAINQLGSIFEDAFGGDKAEPFGAVMKDAAMRYLAQHPGEPPTNVAQLRPYMRADEPVIQQIKVAFAHFQYVLDHDGAAARTAADLQPYLAALAKNDAVLQTLKLSGDGDHGSMSFEWTSP